MLKCCTHTEQHCAQHSSKHPLDVTNEPNGSYVMSKVKIYLNFGQAMTLYKDFSRWMQSGSLETVPIVLSVTFYCCRLAPPVVFSLIQSR